MRWYAFGLGSNDVLAQANAAAGTRTTFIPDIQGSIVATLDSSTGTLTKIGYLPYGASPATPVTFGYTGQRIDPETNGLYYYRARHYSPAWGRFMQPDPIGYSGGINLYRYVSNDPLNLTDPFGFITDGPPNAAASKDSPQGGSSLAGLGALGVAGVIAGNVVGFPEVEIGEGVAAILLGGTAVIGAGAIILNNQDQGSAPPQATPQAPPLPEDLVGVQDDLSGMRGNRNNSGPLAPENGGTGNAQGDFDKLTGGQNGPVPAGSSYPPGTLIGSNGITLRPGTENAGPRIDVPANGSKPHETLHY